MFSPFHIRASKFTFDNNEQMAFMKSLLQRMFYLVGIKPLLKPQLALPAEQEDKLDHDEQAELLLRQQEQPALPSSLSPLPTYAGSLAPLKSNVALRVKDIYWIVLGSCVNWLETESRSWKSF